MLQDKAFELALVELQEKSQKAIYRRDPEAWVADVLGNRWWTKQAEIARDYIENPRVAIKSANGTGKSILVADLACHWVSTNTPGDVIAILSAPTLAQIELVVFAYIKRNYGLAKARGLALPGRINESLQWKTDSRDGALTLAVGRKPQDQDIVGSFQGIRRDKGTAVFVDEAGSVPRDLFVAAEAVTTGGGDHKIIMIGNPDNGRGSAFFDLWDKKGNEKFWKLHTISAFDLPTFTGEIVYSDPERQEAMLKSGMQTPEKVESWRIMWGEDSARWKSKVLGEFPEDSDGIFFTQQSINKSYETDIEEDLSTPLILGVDVALGGQDETVIYGNRGGRIRKMHVIPDMDSYTGAQQIDEFARSVDAAEVRVDAAGTGQGVFENLLSDPKYAKSNYRLIGLKGSYASPDKAVWANHRAWHYDQFRAGMLTGKIDLDPTETDLRDEIVAQTAEFNRMGALQITPKLKMRSEGLPSPDNLDAAIYSYINPNPDEDELKPGQKVYQDPLDYLGEIPDYLQQLTRF